MNNSSKVIFLGTVTMIVAAYSLSIKDVQSARLQTGLANINRVQAVYSADAAMRSALSTYQYYDGKESVSGRKYLPNGSGYFDYWVAKAYGSTTATVKLYLPDGSTQVLSALVEKVASGHGVKQGIRKIHKGNFQLSGYYAGVVQKHNK